MHAKLLTKMNFDMCRVMIHGAVPWPVVIIGVKIIKTPFYSLDLQIYRNETKDG